MRALVEIFVALCVLCFNTTFAQEYKHNVKGAKKIEISELVGQIKIQGHNGAELVIKASELPETPERAKGLKPISTGGVDNTKIGLSLTETDQVISISGVTKQSSEADYIFMIPDGLAVEIDYSSPFADDKLEVEGFGGELEISTLNSDVALMSITGPVVLDMVNGNIDLVFSSVNQDSPMSIKTINGDIDISFPSNAKAGLEMSSLHGDIYTDLDIKVNREKEEGLKFIGGMSNINGTLNGGGVEMAISTINGNIYLRSK